MALGVGLFGFVGLLLAPRLLLVEGPVRSADAIVLLGGDDGSRATRAAELFHQGYAPVIIITGDWEMRPEELVRLGVPSAAILVEDKAQSTAENAEFTLRMMQQRGWSRALVVTSWWHTRRARWCLERYGRDIEWSVQPTWQTPEIAAKWGSPTPAILKEYIKFAWYLARY